MDKRSRFMQNLPSTYFMRFTILFSIAFLLTASLSCRKCYTCTSQTAFGPVDRDICGRKGDILPLVQHLETDTLNPWVCEKN
jgi:hypothetical protein